MHPLVQFHIPSRLCNPSELCFSKSELTSDELFQQKAINTILLQPYNPKLEIVEKKHPTHCLAVAIHYQLHQKLCAIFPESQSNTADMFGVKCKKIYTSVSGCMHNAGKKLTKVEKKKCEAQEYELKKKKLMGHPQKVEKQNKTTPEKRRSRENLRDR